VIASERKLVPQPKGARHGRRPLPIKIVARENKGSWDAGALR
jgi:hypothetical protein